MPPLRSFELRQHGIDHVHVIAVEHTFGDAQGLDVGVFDQIFQFMLLIIGVDGDQHRSQFSRSIKKSQPIGDIGSPNAYMRSSSDTNGHQAFGHIIYSLIKLLVGKAQVSVGIDQVLTIGGGCCPVFQEFSYGTIT